MTVGQVQKGVTCMQWKSQEENKEMETEKTFETTVTENAPKFRSGDKPQIQEAQIHAKVSIFWQYPFKLRKIRNKGKNPERSQREKTFYLKRNKENNYIQLLRNQSNKRRVEQNI